jgi:hypothetical protein
VSARAGKPASVALKGFGLSLPNAQSVALVDAADCYITGASFASSGIKAILTGAPSTAEEYTFVGDVPAGLKGKYTLCMCDDESWATNRFSGRELRPHRPSGHGEGLLGRVLVLRRV